MRLSEKRWLTLVWILSNKDRSWSILDLQKSSKSLGYGPIWDFVKELERSGFITKDESSNEFRVSKARDLIQLMALSRPLSTLFPRLFYSAKDFTAKLELVSRAKMDYALTVFGASELWRSYVKTELVHFYVQTKDLSKWEKYLLSNGCLKAERSDANILLHPVPLESFFSLTQTIKRLKVAPAPVVLADLISFGSLGQEQAQFLMEEWLSGRMK
ncbi:MAG: hypothetical protein V1777_03960 [Candidatus Micrarchaeota archaeon]